jgi:hypothetical protein
MTLVAYLSNLNTCENQWSLFVNPENVDDYRIGQDCFENGGMLDAKVNVASLDDVSFGFQSRSEALEFILKYADLKFKAKKINFNKQAMIEAYNEDLLGEDFKKYLDELIDEHVEINSIAEAELYVENLQDELKAGKYFVLGE